MATKRIPRFNKKSLARPLAIQDLAVRARFPQFKFHRDGSYGVWRGYFRPRESSPEFHLEVRYRPGSIPIVKLLSPTLHPDVPHVYQPDNDLCLYWPKDDPWQSTNLLATFIFPLAWSWIGYYELWLETGIWFGPESPHRRPSRSTGQDSA
jgi:hypothetical protein